MENTEKVTKKYRVKGHRILADGTVKDYYYNKSYKVKNGVNDRRKEGNSGPKEKLSPEQKEKIWARYCDGVTIKRIHTDLGLSYIPVKKCIDKKKAELSAEKPSSADSSFDYSHVCKPV